ncbi:GNAT family N-acetyltransferase [Frigidibacter sp. MR17.24]|uniref:GNAT family N-acetyltransferase n=1 Tax=Frigidibacter sp. MR17.24 TaxID=3127345 RepID=UPI003012FBCD
MPDTAPMTIRPACFPGDLGAVRGLFTAYAQGLGIDLGFQDFAAELAALPGKYAPPGGAVLLAESGAPPQAIGCIALRPLPLPDGPATCEMKRLYLGPAARGRGLGRALVERLVAEARGLGYRRMVLDTLSTMTPALALYRAQGFTEIPAYYHNPLAGVVYLGRDL